MNRILESCETPLKPASTAAEQTLQRFTCLCFAFFIWLFTTLARAEEAPAEVTEKVHSSLSAATVFDVTVACARIVVRDEIFLLASLSRSSPRRQPLDSLDQWLQPVGATLDEGIEFVLAGVEQSNRFGMYHQVATSVWPLADSALSPIKP